jgi:hypothetical protein
VADGGDGGWLLGEPPEHAAETGVSSAAATASASNRVLTTLAPAGRSPLR